MKASWKGKRGTPSERGYGHDWVKLRNNYIRHNPLCEHRGPGCKGIARIVHHVKPVTERPDLRLERSNLMSVCDPCHRQLHNEKSPGVVVAVCGAPASGKTTYVRDRISPGEFVWDWDDVRDALGLSPESTVGETWMLKDIRSTIVQRVCSGAISKTLWMIITSPLTASKIADQYIIMDRSESECVATIKDRYRGSSSQSAERRVLRVVSDWFTRYGHLSGTNGECSALRTALGIPPGSPIQGDIISTNAAHPQIYPHGKGGDYEPRETTELLRRIDRAGDTGWQADPASG